MTAIDAIPRLGEAGKPLVPDALAKIKTGNTYARYAALGLVATLPRADAEKVAGEVGDLATHEESLIRLRVGRVLEKLGPAGAPAAEALGKAISSEENSGVRDQFIDALIAMGPGAKLALPGLLKVAANPMTPPAQRERIVAAVVVADPASKDVAAALLAAAGDEAQYVRGPRRRALGNSTPSPPRHWRNSYRWRRPTRTLAFCFARCGH